MADARIRRCWAGNPLRWLVVGAEPITRVGVTSADSLAELDTALHEADIELCFAEMKGPVKDKLKRFGLFSRLGEQRAGEAMPSVVQTASGPVCDQLPPTRPDSGRRV